MKIGDRVKPSRSGGPPWREGVIESIDDRPIRMPIGVRLTDAPIGYLGSLGFFAADELQVIDNG